MFFYLVAPIGLNSPLLTYKSSIEFKPFSVVLVSLKNKTIQAVILESTFEPNFECKDIIKQVGFLNKTQENLARFCASYYRATWQETLNLFVPFKLESSQDFKLDSACLESIKNNLATLNNAQTKALNFLDSRQKGLLFGDTGSGKSEVYFHLIFNALKENKSVLFLMPEIALTPQILKRLESIFGDIIGVWHSKITKSKKEILHSKLHNGEVKIIVGARSALFLPIKDLGLIIIDEEHDDAYKAQNNPRYNARDLCLFLNKKENIKVILGSATPSVTSYKLALESNYLFRLKGQFFNSSKQFILENSKTQLNENLISLINKTLNDKKQVVVFLPTRANFKSLQCFNCGLGVKCPFCSVNMSVHLNQNSLICHYCNYRCDIPNICPSCKNGELFSNRIGTQQIALELKDKLDSSFNIEVFDKDSISTANKLNKILENFNNHKIDMLIGTQMLSKGHDYHNVELAVILGIDYVLNNSEYRSFEKGISLIFQIAGRAGRKNNGKVFLQSLQLGLIEPFLNDYQDFLAWELANRSHTYPPFSKIAMIHFSDKNEKKAESNMLNFVNKFKSLDSSKVKLVGYGKNGIEKIANKFRFHALLNAKSSLDILEALKDFPKLDIDIDALDTM